MEVGENTLNRLPSQDCSYLIGDILLAKLDQAKGFGICPCMHHWCLASPPMQLPLSNQVSPCQHQYERVPAGGPACVLLTSSATHTAMISSGTLVPSSRNCSPVELRRSGSQSACRERLSVAHARKAPSYYPAKGGPWGTLRKFSLFNRLLCRLLNQL